MNPILLPMAFAALLAGVLVIFFTPVVKMLATKAGAVREVRARDSHDKPMPLWGGLAMFAAFVLAVLLLRPLVGHNFVLDVGKGEHPILGIMLGASLVAVIGMLDDKLDLPPLVQTGALLLGGFIAAALGARVDGITNPFAPTGGGYTAQNYLSLGPFAIPLTMIWIFFAAKTFDFLDGLDGLAAGVCAIAASTMGLIAASRGEAAVAVMAGALAGACIGFLRYNFNPASIFMGTIGSQFLGFVLAGLAIVGTAKVPTVLAVAVPILVLGVPVIDGLYVVARRMASGKNPTKADKTHIHHRLRSGGLTVRRAVWAIYGLTAAGCALALILVYVLTQVRH